VADDSDKRAEPASGRRLEQALARGENRSRDLSVLLAPPFFCSSLRATPLSVMAIAQALPAQAVQGTGDAAGIESGHLRRLLSCFLWRAVPQLKVMANAGMPNPLTLGVTLIIGART